MSCANNPTLPMHKYGHAAHVLRESLYTMCIQVECRDDRVQSWSPLLTWQSLTALILKPGKERFGPCMIQLFSTLDTAFFLAASAAVCLRISRAIQLCTMVVLQGLRPKICSEGSCHDEEANKQATACQKLPQKQLLHPIISVFFDVT
jgi:hypothetical protein